MSPSRSCRLLLLAILALPLLLSACDLLDLVVGAGGSGGLSLDNSPPTVTIEEGDVTVANGAPQTFTADARDHDGDSLSYQWYVNHTKLLTETSTTFTIRRTPDIETVYVVTVIVSDGNLTAVASVNLTVRSPDGSMEATIQ